MRKRHRLIPVILALALPALASAASKSPESEPLVVSPDALAPVPTPAPANSARTFVPLHSTLVGQGGMKYLNLSSALSIHNTSPSNPLLIEKIDYRDGTGKLIESYVTTPIAIKPYAAIQVLIAKDDVRGGTGASFTIDWATADSADEPVIEALMTSTSGTQSFSFLSAGRRISRR